MGIARPLTITQGVNVHSDRHRAVLTRRCRRTGGLDVAQVIQRDLESTGRFKAMAREDMVFKPTTAADIDAAGWKQQRVDYVAVGRVTSLADGQIRIDAELVNVLTGQRVAGPNVTTAAANLRNAAHRSRMRCSKKSSAYAAHSPRVLPTSRSMASRRSRPTSSTWPMPMARIE
jgi:hypothetical protein